MPKKPIDFAALRKLARFLDTLPPRKFDFDYLVMGWNARRECGAVGCAIGWCPAVFPKRIRWTNGFCGPSAELVHVSGRHGRTEFEEDNYLTLARGLFNLTTSEAERLFTPGEQLTWFYSDATGVVAQLGSACSADAYYGYYAATPKNVAQSIRAYVRWKQTGKKTDPRTVLK